MDTETNAPSDESLLDLLRAECLQTCPAYATLLHAVTHYEASED